MINDDKRELFAVIVAIEEYRFSEESGINNVKYAKNDAIAFKKLLIEDFGFEEKNIIIWVNEKATITTLENELPYFLRQLTKDSRFYFYYAGHGFYQKGVNKLTCWDSYPSNLDGTSVSLRKILFKPLEESDCNQSLVFLDTCATELTSNVDARDLISSFNYADLEEFLRTEKYHAVFMSCSPGEKSFPNSILKHGIWTWHLIQALKGNVSEVLLRDVFITDALLKNYLSDAIPKFITKETTLRQTQKPYAKISSSNDFIIRKIKRVEDTASKGLPKVKLDFDSTSLRRIDFIDVKKASGFKKHSHFLPKRVDESSNSFIQTVFNDELEKEIQKIYEKTKTVFSLRKREIEYGVEEGKGSIDNDFFRYSITVEQDSDNPVLAEVTRKLEIRVNRESLPERFDDVFPKQIEEIVIPIQGLIDFDELVEKFENLELLDGGKLSDNELKGEIEYQTSDGLTISISLEEMELSISPNRYMKCLELIDTSIEGLKKISSNNVQLLN